MMSLTEFLYLKLWSPIRQIWFVPLGTMHKTDSTWFTHWQIIFICNAQTSQKKTTRRSYCVREREKKKKRDLQNQSTTWTCFGKPDPEAEPEKLLRVIVSPRETFQPIWLNLTSDLTDIRYYTILSRYTHTHTEGHFRMSRVLLLLRRTLFRCVEDVPRHAWPTKTNKATLETVAQSLGAYCFSLFLFRSQ